MRFLETALFLLGRGFRNIWKHKLASFFSFCIIAATLLLFCFAASVSANLNFLVKTASDEVGITAFFEENISEEEIAALRGQIEARSEFSHMRYISAEEAWENFKSVYFAENEDLASGFSEDNPLADSASFEIFLNDSRSQDAFVVWLKGLSGIRKVNYAASLLEGVNSVRRFLLAASVLTIGVLIVIAVLLISNSISMTIELRRQEIHIQRYIGATNAMILCPFLLEGFITGLVGAGVPLLIVLGSYNKLIGRLAAELGTFGSGLKFLPLGRIAALTVPTALLLGVGLGILGSLLSIRKHLKV